MASDFACRREIMSAKAFSFSRVCESGNSMHPWPALVSERGEVYTGTPLLWTPWGPGEVSCIERYSLFRAIFRLRKHTAKCPYFRGVGLHCT